MVYFYLFSNSNRPKLVDDFQKSFWTGVQFSPSPILKKYFIKKLEKKLKFYNQIPSSTVRLISEDGENLGIVSKEKAFDLAREKRLDLIIITSKIDPPIVKLGDYGKYLYRQQKKASKQKKGQKLGKVKNIRISLRIAQHDLLNKINQAIKFLNKGFRVRFEIFLKGREKRLQNEAKEKLNLVISEIGKEVAIEQDGEIKKNPRGFEIIIRKK